MRARLISSKKARKFANTGGMELLPESLAPNAPVMTEMARSRLSRGLVSLAASLIVIDGPLNREEYSAFRILFPMPMRRDLHVREWLHDGCRNPISPSSAKDLLGQLFVGHPALREEILARFVALAWADASVVPVEHDWLEFFTNSIALDQHLLGELLMLVKPYAREKDPYSLLEVAEDASLADIKHAWLQQLRAFHPDSLAAQGLPIEEQQRFGHKMTEINAAYDKILKSRGAR